VIRDTELENLFYAGEYSPLSIEEAIKWIKPLVTAFEDANVKILRIGLHPSEGLLNGENLVAGPFHPAFGEMVRSALWNDLFTVWIITELQHLFKTTPGTCLIVETARGESNSAIGYKAVNKKMLLNYFGRIKFVEKRELSGRRFNTRIV
jgi:histone acetyltransferase (RNA polymerase elongator complex component)